MTENKSTMCDDKHKNKLYCGSEAFSILKAKASILYGNEFKYDGYTIIENTKLYPGQMITKDKDLAELLKGHVEYKPLNEK